MFLKRAHLQVIALLAILGAAAALNPLWADNGKREDGEGKYAQWTAQWWQWVYSLPVSENPLFDETGALADTAQPNKDAFFLAGVISQSNTASRSITIPQGTPLFGPVINFENDNVGRPNPMTVPELRAGAAAVEDTAEYSLELDGVARPDLISRIKSPVFEYTLPDEDNIYQFFGLDVTGTVRPAVSDGFWFYIPPLPVGTHTLTFSGTTPGFALEIEYTITVQ
jgi:hypothetical protein